MRRRGEGAEYRRPAHAAPAAVGNAGRCAARPGSPVAVTTASLVAGGGRRRYRLPVSSARRCSRTACARPAVATLTYVYSDQTAVLGPLATFAEPHAYDLCEAHSERLSAPRG